MPKDEKKAMAGRLSALKRWGERSKAGDTVTRRIFASDAEYMAGAFGTPFTADAVHELVEFHKKHGQKKKGRVKKPD